LNSVLLIITSCGYNLTFFGGYCLKRRDLLLYFFAFTLWTTVFFLFIVGNRKDYAKRFFTFFTVELICGHATPPFLGGIPHNNRSDTIFMLVSNYLVTGGLATPSRVIGSHPLFELFKYKQNEVEID
jgi:hypothetical protein